MPRPCPTHDQPHRRQSAGRWLRHRKNTVDDEVITSLEAVEAGVIRAVAGAPHDKSKVCLGASRHRLQAGDARKAHRSLHVSCSLGHRAQLSRGADIGEWVTVDPILPNAKKVVGGRSRGVLIVQPHVKCRDIGKRHARHGRCDGEAPEGVLRNGRGLSLGSQSILPPRTHSRVRLSTGKRAGKPRDDSGGTRGGRRKRA